MAASSQGYHEPLEKLSAGTMDQHRAVVSIMEELEAVDWYDQRKDATGDPDLIAILEHNRDEEVEHAAMLLEWLRRRNPVVERELKERLFRDGPIVREGDEEQESAGAHGDGSLGIGSLREEASA